jgi:hypothetical protein
MGYDYGKNAMQELLDKEHIRDLLNLYCHCMDAPDYSRAAMEVYAADAIDDHGFGEWKGAEEIVKNLAQLRVPFKGTAHVLTNVNIKLHGDHARSRSYVLSLHWLHETRHEGPAKQADFCGIGVYEDEMYRFPDGWRITIRVYRPMVRGGSIAFGELPEFLMRGTSG